ASPVRLRAAGGGRFRGALRPLLHVEHLFLVVRTVDGGATQAFIRNPEHNLGAYVGLRTVIREGARVRLTRPGKPDVVGRYDARRKTLMLALRFGDATATFPCARATPANSAAFYARPNVERYAYHK